MITLFGQQEDKVIQVGDLISGTKFQVCATHAIALFLDPVPNTEVQACQDECVYRSVCPFNEDVLQLCNLLMKENHWDIQHSLLDCVDLYLKLWQQIKSQL